MISALYIEDAPQNTRNEVKVMIRRQIAAFFREWWHALGVMVRLW